MSDAQTQVARLYFICLGFRTSETPAGTRESNYAAYLIQTEDRRNILVDTGFPVGMEPVDAAGNAHPGVVAQLASIGIAPQQVDTLVCTHYDLDHCGQNDVFANAVHVVQRKQHEEAARGYERYQRGRAHWDAPTLNRQLIEGDFSLLPGVQLLDTDGHAPGHQSLLVTLPQTGKVLLTIDAVPRRVVFSRERTDFAIDEDKDAAAASTVRLVEIAESEQPALVVFGHDGPQWRTLRVLPDYYE